MKNFYPFFISITLMLGLFFTAQAQPGLTVEVGERTDEPNGGYVQIGVSNTFIAIDDYNIQHKTGQGANDFGELSINRWGGDVDISPLGHVRIADGQGGEVTLGGSGDVSIAPYGGDVFVGQTINIDNTQNRVRIGDVLYNPQETLEVDGSTWVYDTIKVGNPPSPGWPLVDWGEVHHGQERHHPSATQWSILSLNLPDLNRTA